MSKHDNKPAQTLADDQLAAVEQANRARYLCGLEVCMDRLWSVFACLTDAHLKGKMNDDPDLYTILTEKGWESLHVMAHIFHDEEAFKGEIEGLIGYDGLKPYEARQAAYLDIVKETTRPGASDRNAGIARIHGALGIGEHADEMSA